MGQSSKEPRISAEPLNLIDLPTAGSLYHRNLSTSLEFINEGGMVINAQAGLFNRVTAGIGFGGSNVIGFQNASFNPRIGVLVKVRALEETYYIPAFTLGFNSQGKGSFIDSLDRYEIKSVGFFAVASKNFQLLGFFSIHAGIHYSLEDTDHRTLNLFAGIEKTFASIFSGVIEYDNGFSLANSTTIEKGRGMFNGGLRAAIGNGFLLGVNLKDIVRNQQQVSIGNRTILIEYSRNF